jgi:hypothetical protein
MKTISITIGIALLSLAHTSSQIAAPEKELGQQYAEVSDAELGAEVMSCEDKEQIILLLDQIPISVMAKHAIERLSTSSATRLKHYRTMRANIAKRIPEDKEQLSKLIAERMVTVLERTSRPKFWKTIEWSVVFPIPLPKPAELKYDGTGTRLIVSWSYGMGLRQRRFDSRETGANPKLQINPFDHLLCCRNCKPKVESDRCCRENESDCHG